MDLFACDLLIAWPCLHSRKLECPVPQRLLVPSHFSFILSAHGKWGTQQFYPSLLCEWQIRRYTWVRRDQESNTLWVLRRFQSGYDRWVSSSLVVWRGTSFCGPWLLHVGRGLEEEWKARSWIPRITLVLRFRFPAFLRPPASSSPSQLFKRKLRYNSLTIKFTI